VSRAFSFVFIWILLPAEEKKWRWNHKKCLSKHWIWL